MDDEGGLGRSLPHVPALDGLRGLALVAVLTYHAEPSWLPGGMIGVTAFFTLSGFLITSLLIRELESTGGVRLRAFWMRRARRLVPASIATVALVAVLVAAGWRAVPSGLVADAASALSWTANWHFVTSGSSYAALFRHPSPFQHFWSLAIEEQVYVMLPVVALVLLGRDARHRLRFALLLAAGIAASTYLAATLHAADPAGGRAYYGTDARLAEPFVGALLAVWLARGGGFARFGRNGARVAGTSALIALAGLGALAWRLSVSDRRLYEGGFLVAALLTAAVITGATQSGTFARVLGTRPLARLGVISYGVYLFHWPIFEWFGARFPRADRVTLIPAELGVTLALATISHQLLESPIRRRRDAPRRIFATGWINASVAALAAIVVVSTVPASHASAARVDLGVGVNDPVAPPPAAAPSHAHQLVAASRPSIPAGRPSKPGVARAPVTPQEAALLTGGTSAGGGDDWSNGRSGSPPGGSGNQLRVAVVGDSLAHNLATGLTKWAQGRTDVVVYDLSISFCPLSRGGERRWEEDESFPVNPSCSWWNDPSSKRSSYLAAFAPDVILDDAGFSEMLDRWQSSWDTWYSPMDRAYQQWLRREYDAMFTAMQTTAGANAHFLNLNLPCGDFSRPKGWERVTDTGPRVSALDQSVYPLLASGSQGDLFKQLCPNGQYSDDLWGIPDARPDGMHLTDEAATELARRWLGPLVQEVGGLNHPGAVLTQPVPG
ncbi:MAG: hypothetical protein QOI47_1212 [Actinomycetota bacterium]|jgi:peptidoglycan/LPS O-acetylase OafA/YrhL|nr:hypothetical protein [Actinomycetota bacterium]